MAERTQPRASELAEDYIGTAWKAEDGTLVLDLRAEGPGGIVGHSQERFKPGTKEFDEVSRHVGPIPAGGSVAVRPFPD